MKFIKCFSELSPLFTNILEVMSVCNSAYIDSFEDPQLTVLSTTNTNSIVKRLPSFRRPRRVSCGKTAPIPDENTSSKKFQSPTLTYSLKLKDLQQNNTIGRPTDVALVKFVGNFLFFFI